MFLKSVLLCMMFCTTLSAPVTDDVAIMQNKGNVTGKNADCMGGGYGASGGFRRMGGYGMGYGMGLGRMGGRLGGASGGVSGGGQTMPMIIVINTGGGAAQTATTAASASLRKRARLKAQNQYKAAAKQLQDFLKTSK